MFLVVLYFSDLEFWVLNVADSVMWLTAALKAFVDYYQDKDGLVQYAACGVFLGVECIFLAALMRRLALLTVSKCAEEMMLRGQAEQKHNRFLSYIMHEIRNPLNGASLLIWEFKGTLEDLLEEGEKSKNIENAQQAIQLSASRLRILSDYLSRQFEKMEGVCNDVLQLEKLSNGNFEFIFRPEDLCTWSSQTAAQEAPLFKLQQGEQFPSDVCSSSSSASSSPCFSFLPASPSFCSSSRQDSSGSSVSPSKRESQSRQEKGNESSSFRRNNPACSVAFSWHLDILPEALEVLKGKPMGVADFVRLAQVVSNFVGNSKKFTKEGSVHLQGLLRIPSDAEVVEAQQPACKKTESEESSTSSQSSAAAQSQTLSCVVLRILVKDTGPGLSASDMEQLFKPYSQVRAGELQNRGGTGLGLCLCKSFVEAHCGGKIGAESEGRGLGSTFFFEVLLPLVERERESTHLNETEEEKEKEKQTLKEDLKGTKDLPNALQFSPFPSPSPSPSPSASSSSESIGSFALAVEETETPEGCREEARVPPGISFSCALHSVSAVASESALAASIPPSGGRGTSEKDRETKAQEEGEENTGGLEGEEKGSVSKAVVTETAWDKPIGKHTADVLLVDDDRFCLMAGSAAIRRLGLSVVTAEDGEEAVDLIVRQKHSFRLVLSDKNMPRMSGPEALKRISDHFADLHQKEADLLSSESQDERGTLKGKNGTEGGEGGVEKGKTLPVSCEQANFQSNRIRHRSDAPLLIGYSGDALTETHGAFYEAGARKVVLKPLTERRLKEILNELNGPNGDTQTSI
uniref:histidine kinase n=1 Tax=Chromera velia CCMP2878 TaxID=1169474 RepID=A0A0G4I3M7_9ALVE|eukprot:Cvel_10701.t1-p1 / transcript=Cvel_10701.t1 / gene=Cvel_10701 / organism=Chromera_velia_CCMP2878 / gene_product=Ethylene receptor 1, putative / transcript_product=Ethylene receptor 1, putative / location=Cvel_scaffold651:18708-21113(-) / protein_length=802 / sequence_SO=supercontig / SO=protein_coding / is_pseudo=false